MTWTDILTIAGIIDCMNLTLGYAEMLTADLSEEQFAHMPHPDMNHPAFCLGHLAVTANGVLKTIGRADLADSKPGFEQLFDTGAKCLEGDGGYPAKEELLAYYLDRYRVLGGAARELDEAALAGPNPSDGRLREMLPTLGGYLNFVLNGHNMAHLGQISAWRRAVGLPGVL